MSVRSGFFNSSNGDRKYDAEDIGNYFRGLITNGVLESIDNRLQVTAGEGLTVNVDTGQAFVNCHWLTNDAMLTLSLAAADVQYSRIDRVVLRLDTSDSVRAITIGILKGANSLNPTAPALTRGVGVHELCLADIYIGANATSINQSNITDRRADTALCGFVTGLIDQVDTSDLYAQYEAAFSQKASEFDAYMIAQRTNFDSWYQTLTEELTVDVDLSLGQYRNIINLTANTSEVSIGIPEFEIGDLLFVYVGGVLFSEGVDYSVSTDKKIIFNDILKGDNIITLICIKSVARNFGDASEILGKIAAVTAEADTNTGTPTVEATLGGTEDAPTLHFSFRNIKGKNGKSIKSVTRKFARSANTTEPTSWQDTVPTLTETYKYLWSYDIIAYSEGEPDETPKGIIGVYGKTGQTGATPNFSIGKVTTLAAGSAASVTLEGTTENPVLNLNIPRGNTGATPNLQIGTVETLEPGSAATAEMGGTAANPILNLGIPKGEAASLNTVPGTVLYSGSGKVSTDIFYY